MKVSFMDLSRMHKSLKNELKKAIDEVIDKNSYILGEKVEKFEENFASYCNVKYAAGVSTGTDALELILRAYNIGRSDEVILPVNSFIATASAVTFANAKPVFVDCAESYNINTDDIEKKITEKTKAIIPVHLYGQPCNMDKILEIANRNNLKVIEDACQSHGAEYKRKKTGSLGYAAAFSFYPAKNLGAFGDAGIVVSNNKNLIEKIKMLRNYGQSVKYHHDLLAFNKRMDAIQAAILDVKLKYLDKWNKQRREAAKEYNIELKELEKVVKKPIEYNDRKHVYHLYVIRTEKRDELENYLTKKGIATGLHYPIPIHLQKAYSNLGYKEGDFPISEKYSKEILSLPIFPGLTSKKIKFVCDGIKEFFKTK